jgi:SAM-dependent methyltransferase
VRALGHRYVGIDNQGADADIICDIHSIPFASDSFDHIITNAVLEHVANPLLACREVARVLKPGGIFSGRAAFLEPYHYRSHFHLSPDGIMSVLSYGGLVVEAIWPQENWSAFDSRAHARPGIVAESAALKLAGAFERLIRQHYWHRES